MVTRRLRQPRTVKTDSEFSREFEIFFVPVRDFPPRIFQAVPRAERNNIAPLSGRPRAGCGAINRAPKPP